MSNREIQRSSAVFALLLLLGAAIWVATSYEKDPLKFSIATGIIGSVFAGFVYTIFAYFINDRPLSRDDVLNLGQTLNGRISHLDRIGVDHLADRSYFGDAFWEKIIIDAGKNPSSTSELILFGRTLDKWAKPRFKTHFTATILSILRCGGRVEILSLMPGSPAAIFLGRASARDLTALSKNFDDFLLEEIYADLEEKHRDRLKRRYIRDLQLTFNLFKADNVLWISPYLSTRNTGTNVALTITPNSSLADLVMDDYRAINRSHGEQSEEFDARVREIKLRGEH